MELFLYIIYYKMPARKSLKRSSSKRLSKRLRTMKRNSKRMSRKSMRGGNGCNKRKSKRSMRGGYSYNDEFRYGLAILKAK